MRSLNFVGLVIAGVAFIGGSVTEASIVQIAVEGQVTSSDVDGFDVGQSFSSVCEYNSDGGPDSELFNMFYYFENRMSSVSFMSGSWNTSDTGSFGQILIGDDVVGFPQSDTIQFQVANDPEAYQTTFPTGTTDLADIGAAAFIDARIFFGSSLTDNWDGTFLPESYDSSTFDADAFGAIVNFSTGMVEVDFDSFEWSIVPAPGTGVMLGMCGLVLTRRRRSS
jgi:hypothetical protein